MHGAAKGMDCVLNNINRAVLEVKRQTSNLSAMAQEGK